ncbi:hypothetical protein [Sphaerisporangium rufum]|nr:hypothetical protein [Sphaerisporangium rufum]
MAFNERVPTRSTGTRRTAALALGPVLAMAAGLVTGPATPAAAGAAGCAVRPPHPAGEPPARQRPAGDDDGRSGHRCPAGPAGPAGPSGAVDTAFAATTTTPEAKYVGVAQGDGGALVRDPTSVAPNPHWHDLSLLPGYPGGAVGISLSPTPLNGTARLAVTVRSVTGQVAQTHCTLAPNVVWPGNCTAFTDLTPPL